MRSCMSTLFTESCTLPAGDFLGVWFQPGELVNQFGAVSVLLYVVVARGSRQETVSVGLRDFSASTESVGCGRRNSTTTT